MAQLITNANGRVKTVEPSDSEAVKSYGGFDGAFGLLFGMAGTSGRNQDLTPTRTGAAGAYQVIPAVNRSVNLRADAVQSLKWELVSSEPTPTSGTTNAPNKPGKDADVQVLDDSEAQEAQTPFGEAMREAQRVARVPLIWQMVFDHDLYGENFVEPLGNRIRKTGMKRLNPLGMRVNVEQGELASYTWTPGGNSSETVDFDADELAYTHTLNPFDDFRGQGLLEVAMDALNVSRNLKRVLLSFFRNNARPSAIVSPVGNDNFSEQNRNIIKTEVQTYVKGSDNAYSTLVSPTPIKLDVFEQPDIASLYSVNDPVNVEIYTIFGVPLAMAGDSGRQRYKSGSDILDAFYMNTVIPLARWIQDYINFQILPFFRMGDVTFRFDLSEFDQASSDDKLRADIATQKFMATLITRNEARVYAGDVPLLTPDGKPTPEGEAFYMPPAPPMLGAGQAAEDGKTPVQVEKEPPKQLAAGDEVKKPDAPAKTEKSLATPLTMEAAYVGLSLANDPEIIAVQDRLKLLYADNSDVEWQTPDTLHITLVYCDGANDDHIAGIARGVEATPIAVHGDKLGIFENDKSRAVYLEVVPSPDLKRLQAALYDQFRSRDLPISAFSDPQAYKPHVTLCYFKNAELQLGTFSVNVHTSSDTVTFGRNDYDTDIRVSLTQKSAPQKSAQAIRFLTETQKSAEDELTAWRKAASKGNALKSFTVLKLDKHVEGFVRDSLESVGAGAEKALVRAVFDDAAYVMGDWGAVKDYDQIASSFQTEAGSLITDAGDDAISDGAFGARYRSALRRAGLQMFRQGMVDSGANPESFSAEQLATFRAWQAKTSGFVGSLRREAYSPDGIPNPDARPDYWTNVSLRGVYYAGAASVAPDALKAWRVGDAEHCPTCLGRAGMVKTLSEWGVDGFPGDFDALDCHGVNCACSLIDPPDNGGAEKSHSRSKCMMCDEPPTKDVKWAEGMARAWFCDKHFEEWSQEHLDDTDYVHDLADGKAPSEFNKAAVKGLETDEQRRWFFAHLGQGYVGRGDAGGSPPRQADFDSMALSHHVTTIDGKFEPDVGSPGDSEDSLNHFLQHSNGALSYAIADPTTGMVSVDYSGADDRFVVNRPVVKAEAMAFVKESQDIRYGRDYLMQVAKEHAAENGVDLADSDVERAYNQQYAVRAQAIQHLARIGDVKLTEAQARRLDIAAKGDYLNMVYSRDDSERGTLTPTRARRNKLGGLKGAARAEARRNFQDWVLGLDV